MAARMDVSNQHELYTQWHDLILHKVVALSTCLTAVNYSVDVPNPISRAYIEYNSTDPNPTFPLYRSAQPQS